MKVDDWVGLIESLPPAWRPYVLLLLTVMPAVSTGLMVIKALFVIPSPKEVDGAWKKLGLYLLALLDVAATNSPPIMTKLKEREARPRTSIIPPGTGLLVLMLPLLLLSCAATPLQRHAQVADGAAQLIDEAGRLLEQRIRQVEEDALDASATRDEAVARIQRLRSTYAPLEAAYEAVRLAHEAYVEAIVRANAAGHGSPEPDVLATLSAAWVELMQRARMLGLVLPAAPPGLAKLLPDPGGAP